MAPRSYDKVSQELPEDVIGVVGALEIETPLSAAEQKAVLRKVALRILPIWCAPRCAPRALAVSGQGQGPILAGMRPHTPTPRSWFTALLAYLDRANLSLAKLQMDCDLSECPRASTRRATARVLRRASLARRAHSSRRRGGYEPLR
jgi:hypothetical protein